MASKNHVQGTVQLVRGKDDDLIRWLGRIPVGGRNAALKHTLRCGLELPQPVAPKTESIQHVAVDMSRVDELERMVVNLQRQLASLMAGAPIESQPHILEAAPELTLEDRQNRANKLKKAEW